MAASCVSCGAVVSRRLLLRPRVSLAPRQVLWKAAELQSVPGPQILRLKHVTVVTTKKNVKALRRETYTVDFIKKQIEEFNIGKRHLANMMGEDPETFTQEDIDRAIAYLFPSGLFEKRARPIMKHPEQIFPKQKAIQWGEDGRPFHYLFYTGKQSYYSLMHDAYGKILDIEKHKNQLQAKGLFSEKNKTIDLIGSRWLIKEELEEMLVEKLSDQDYRQFVRLMERLLQSGAAEEEFVQSFRRSVTVQSKKQPIEPVQRDAQGMAFSTSEGKRKSAKAEAVVYEHGSGRIKVNGIDYLLYFPVLQDSGTAHVRPAGPRAEEAGPGGGPQEVHLEEALSRGRGGAAPLLVADTPRPPWAGGPLQTLGCERLLSNAAWQRVPFKNHFEKR
ncbi:28S ribosomal protein S9, mitochondrial isoform X2 [Pipistrellus kuhlii]|uniref:28S ribosomal protein S9, mitochondrial isoform X2 n=1 Tax=Pipistrellus kuhlii TaxID=59472 RepID=UPI001E26FDF2|nr:28S ribosomal protein S9, mitochondrial isoform X2 [Pipistrellus kuhlii]